MQPSEYEIQREVEVLRDLKRRSTAPGALTIDPDLPNNSSSTSPTNGYWDPDDLEPLSAVPGPSKNTGDTTLSDDPLHLFWVPAAVHPEIAPAEFRAFLKEHARSPLPEDSATLSRSNSSSSLGRKKSMLSRQYRPSEDDGVENERVVPLRRNRTSLYATSGPQLTINDLQRLEELAEEASESDDPSKLRNILRRSLSLNMSPSAIDKMDDMPDMGDEADAPIIVPPPGQILRRAARTKIRKPGLPGDGGGHRFGASRRGGARVAVQAPATSYADRTSSDMSSSDHGDNVEPSIAPRRPTSDGAPGAPRPDSYSEAVSIYDAYADDPEEEVAAPALVIPTPSQEQEVSLPLSLPTPETPPSLLEALAPVLHQPQPQKLLIPEATLEPRTSISRTPSPGSSTDNLVQPGSPAPSVSAPAQAISPTPAHHQPYAATTSSTQDRRKDKDKKGLFGKWGGDKGGKKGGKDRDSRERGSGSEKDSGFFGSLFGSKKKQDDPGQPLGHGTTSGREAAQALLGASKSSKSYVPPTSPIPVGGNPWARYPLHVERAIYRLSHIKLANPRRPLYEQVLISNLMFWYLGVINKATTPPPGQQPAAGTGQNAAGAESTDGVSPATPDEKLVQQQQEQAAREREEEQARQRAEAERAEKEREMEMKKKETTKRGPLSRPPPAGSGRRAETPVKGPQYEMQHRVMEQEYGGYSNSSPQSRASPAVDGGYAQRTQSPQPQLQSAPEQYYSSALEQMHHQNHQTRGLPPGAMPPVSSDQNWVTQQPPRSSSVPPRQHGSPSPPPINNAPQRRSRSPPQQYIPPQTFTAGGKRRDVSPIDASAGNRSPARSLSASATAPVAQQPNGKLRKGTSAHAVSYTGRSRPGPNGVAVGGEEEDVPLAVWRQQQQR